MKKVLRLVIVVACFVIPIWISTTFFPDSDVLFILACIPFGVIALWPMISVLISDMKKLPKRQEVYTKEMSLLTPQERKRRQLNELYGVAGIAGLGMMAFSKSLMSSMGIVVSIIYGLVALLLLSFGMKCIRYTMSSNAKKNTDMV
jgi:hypothetical protein